MYYTYILKSRLSNKTFTGSTNNITRRLSEHNRGKIKSSQEYKPYDVILIENFGTALEAKQREDFYKTASGQREIINLLKCRVCRDTTHLVKSKKDGKATL